jgi:hopanoid biosynthesis associated protein HpnK
MAETRPARRLIVNADDFGQSPSINAAIRQAHCNGILTTASLMVNGEAFAEAVELARTHPRLGVGLHLSLAFGAATLPPAQIPGLVDERGRFSENPVAVGLRYFFNRSLRDALRREIAAQFDRFQATGLPLDHVNGHLNLHLHPTVFRLLLDETAVRRVGAVRLTRDRFWLNARLAGGEWPYRVSHAIIFHLLSAGACPALRRRQIRFTRVVFGLLQNGRVDEAFVLRLLPRLPAGDSELYSHPSLDNFRAEFEALISPRVSALVARLNIRLIRYQDL